MVDTAKHDYASTTIPSYQGKETTTAVVAVNSPFKCTLKMYLGQRMSTGVG